MTSVELNVYNIFLEIFFLIRMEYCTVYIKPAGTECSGMHILSIVHSNVVGLCVSCMSVMVRWLLV